MPCFCPKAAQDLSLIAGELEKRRLRSQKHTQLIGTGLWDVADIGHVDILAGGWYAASDPRARQKFHRLPMLKTYGQEPPRLVTLGL